MAPEALILPMIKKLEVWEKRVSCLSFRRIIPCFSDGRKSETETKVIDELRMIVDILRDKKLREGRRLHFLISDLVEMAQDALDLYQHQRTYNEMESIKIWIKEIKMRFLKLSVDGEETSELSKMRSENVDGEEDDVVGLEEDGELLLRANIVNNNRSLCLFLIKGVAGIGKTTLARQIYKHEDVVDQFDRRAWVCVSSELTLKEILMKLIQQVVESHEQLPRDLLLEHLELADNRNLQQMLYQYLQGMRYFIVLDDLPEEMRLESILKALPYEDARSTLLVTSRTSPRSILEFRHSFREMEPLDFEQSWQLFLKTVFRGSEATSEHGFPKQMEKMGRDMLLTKCGGVPLAIKETARQLAAKRQSGSEWEQLLQPTDLHAILEALILPMILKRDSVEDQWTLMKEVTNDLKTILDLVRDKKLGEGSRLYYMICDLINMAHELIKNSFISFEEIYSVAKWTTEVKSRMLDLAVDGAETASPIRSENVGDEEEDVVGLGEDVKLLLRKVIFNEDKSLYTSMITGMVGIGKTTLVRQVYNHADIVGHFDRRAWVYVSSDFSHKEVLIKLIQQVVDSEELERDLLLEKMERPENLGLHQMLQKHLKGMRYLIVLDDLPTKIRLEYIMKGLPNEDNGSRLLLASPSVYVGAIVPSYIHTVKTLDPNKSWQLFLKTISSANKFTSDQLEFPKHLKEMGKDKLRKCSGLPLAIKQVGRQIAKEIRSGGEWEQLLESIDLSSTLELMEPRYKKMNPQLKSCFLHLAFFKENITYRREKMEQIWAIGGLVSGDEFEIGLHISHLCLESIVESMDSFVYGRTRTFRMNAVLHSLSIKMAEDEIDFEIQRYNGNNRPSQSPRHRVIICSREEFSYSMNHGNKHLISLFFHGGGYLEASPSYWNSFEELRILDLEDFGIKILPESIGALSELRYLGLRNNYIQELPNSLGCLRKLEVLDIAQNFMVKVPDIIWELGSLRHLYMSDVICRRPLNIDTLKNLKTLTYISINDWINEVWGWQMITSLCKLGIEELDENSYITKLLVSLADLEDLKHLILRGYRFRSMPCLDGLGVLKGLRSLKLDGLLPRLPYFPPYIEYLKLVNSCLDEDPMPVLEKLFNLKYLKLRNAYTGQKMVISRYGFLSLYKLCIEELWNLRNVQVGEGAFQRIERLEIKNCPNLETLQEEIGSTIEVPVLTMLTTRNIAAKFRKSALVSKLKLVEIKP